MKFLMTTGFFNKILPTHIEIIEHKNGATITFHHLLTRIVGLQTVQIGILWITLFGTNWSTSSTGTKLDQNRETLIQQLKLSVKKNWKISRG